MFDLLADAAMVAGRGPAVGAWARVENAACARRLSAMADVMDARWSADGSADRDQWYSDNWSAVAAEVAAHQGVSLGVASHQTLTAMALRERLSRVDEVFQAGEISERVVTAIVSRTALLIDAHARVKIDIELASVVAGWGTLSQAKVEQAIDDAVQRHDPDAVRRMQHRARGRHADVGRPDGSGLSTVEAELLDHDAAVLDKRLDAMAAAVCADDPRTLDQRRGDALGAIANLADRIACLCGDSECPAADATPSAVVINVIAPEESLADDTPVQLDGAEPDRVGREMTLAEAAVDSTTTGPAQTPPAVMIGGGLIPAPLLAAKVAAGATIRWIIHPGDAPPEPRYRPSVKLARFVRCRDMTCRFPGCSKPADICDLDHTIAYPVGPTCASNLKCLCREHHLLKTFWAGRAGWRDRQLPDGTVVWTDPHGQTHVTRPGSYRLFPTLCTPTAPVVLNRAQLATAEEHPPANGLTMPRRKRTRAEDRARRIAEERRLNAEALKLEKSLCPSLPHSNDPPPF